MEYIVVQMEGLEAFVKEVNAKIKQGYEPLGGIDVISISANLKGWIFTQAMVKTD